MQKLLLVLVVVLFLLVFRLMDEVGTLHDHAASLGDSVMRLSETLDKYQKAYWCEHKHGPSEACQSAPKVPRKIVRPLRESL